VDAIDQQIDELRTRWSVDEFERQQRKEERRQEVLLRAKNRLLSGEWIPKVCQCSRCLRSVLEMTAPDGLCDVGRTAGERYGVWWQ